jgi:AbrB family looped-hinge helix DNA binding protein
MASAYNVSVRGYSESQGLRNISHGEGVATKPPVAGQQPSHPPEFSRVRVDSAGRVVVPSELRQRLGIEPGYDLILSVDAQGIRLQTFEQTVKAVQEAFAPYRVPGVSVVDELIREREEEARRESDE